MEDLKKLYKNAESYAEEFKNLTEKWSQILEGILANSIPAVDVQNTLNNLPIVSPQQTKKRAKRLTSLEEEEEVPEKTISTVPTIDSSETSIKGTDGTQIKDSIVSTPAPRTKLKNMVANCKTKKLPVSCNVMQPQPAPVLSRQDTDVSVNIAEALDYSGRPKLSATIQTKKVRKEPKLNTKLRRPSDSDIIIKKEPDERNSQIFINNTRNSNKSAVNDAVVITSAITGSITSTSSQPNNGIQEEMRRTSQQFLVKIKQEKISLDNQISTNKGNENEIEGPVSKSVIEGQSQLDSKMAVTENSTIAPHMALVSSTNADIGETTGKKKGATSKKKKAIVRPIKVERFSDLEVCPAALPSQIASRTRKANVSQKQKSTDTATISNEAVEIGKSFDKTNETEGGKKNIKDKQPVTANVQITDAIPSINANVAYNIVHADLRTDLSSTTANCETKKLPVSCNVMQPPPAPQHNTIPPHMALVSSTNDDIGVTTGKKKSATSKKKKANIRPIKVERFSDLEVCPAAVPSQIASRTRKANDSPKQKSSGTAAILNDGVENRKSFNKNNGTEGGKKNIKDKEHIPANVQITDAIPSINANVAYNIVHADLRTELSSTAANCKTKKLPESCNVMQPPPAPGLSHQDTDVSVNIAEALDYSGRPKLSATIQAKKVRKEPKLNTKLRRPSDSDIVIKKEPDERNSQIFINNTRNSNESGVNDEVIITSAITGSITSTSSQPNNGIQEEMRRTSQQFLVKIKQEKISLDNQISTNKGNENEIEGPVSKSVIKGQSQLDSKMAVTENSTIAPHMALVSSTNADIGETTGKKKGATSKKKKANIRPIKVERFSDLEVCPAAVPSQIASRTRKAYDSPKQKSSDTAAILNDGVENRKSFNKNNRTEGGKKNIKDKEHIPANVQITDAIPSINANVAYNIVHADLRTELSSTAANCKTKKLPVSCNVMQPQPAPVLSRQDTDVSVNIAEALDYSGRPKLSATIQTKKVRKEPKLNTKLRRPSDSDIIIKKEPDERNSQIFINNTRNSNESGVNDEVIITSAITGSITSTSSQPNNGIQEEMRRTSQQFLVKIKQEKISLDNQISTNKGNENEIEGPVSKSVIEGQSQLDSKMAVTENSTIAPHMALVSSTNADIGETTGKKKGATSKKKKAIVRPIKVERFSDLEVCPAALPSQMASRTRKANVSQKQKSTDTATISNEAVEIGKSFDKTNETEGGKKNIKDKQPVTANVQITDAIPSINANVAYNIVHADLRTDLSSTAANCKTKKLPESCNVMQPPPAPGLSRQDTDVSVNIAEALDDSERPKLSATIQTEKVRKEPKLNTKLRRPSDSDIVIKKESEKHNSQIFIKNTRSSNESAVNDAVVITSAITGSITSTSSQPNNGIQEEMRRTSQQFLVKIKQEKISLDNQISTNKGNENEIEGPVFKSVIEGQSQLASKMPVTESNTISPHMALVSSTNADIGETTGKKKSATSKKKKANIRPIKVERFSDLEVCPAALPSQIASRTRKSNVSPKQKSSDTATILNEAVESGKLFDTNNETEEGEKNVKDKQHVTANVQVTDAIPNSNANATYNIVHATFCINNNAQQSQHQNANTAQNVSSTFILDENTNATQHVLGTTFDVSNDVKKKNDYNPVESTFETGKDTSIHINSNNSLITDHESLKNVIGAAVPLNINNSATKLVTSYNSTKSASAVTMPNVLSALKPLSKCSSNKTKELFNPLEPSPVKMRVKAFENATTTFSTTPSNVYNSNTTPTMNKSEAPNLGRFLSPNQVTNIPHAFAAASKKLLHSASKVVSAAAPLYKSVSVLNLKQKAPSGACSHRENDSVDIREGLEYQADERKKLREQKSKMAAQVRKTKERERALRLEKAKQERDEKRLEKISGQEKIGAAAAAKMKVKSELLMKKQQKQHISRPLPQASSNIYTFEMLHEYDSTDDERKVSHKRPPPPTWSLSHVRRSAILMQQYLPDELIDDFFSVEPTTPNLKEIFPTINERYLKRNSSALWNTPPRYSELPKY